MPTISVEERRNKVAELMVEGYSQREIGDKLNVSHVTIHKDQKAIKAEWVQNRTETLDDHKEEQVSRLEWLFREHHKLYRQSQVELDGDGNQVQVPGNREHLRDILTTVQEICKIRNLYPKEAPTQLNLNLNQLVGELRNTPLEDLRQAYYQQPAATTLEYQGEQVHGTNGTGTYQHRKPD